jgi:hypothetical protein
VRPSGVIARAQGSEPTTTGVPTRPLAVPTGVTVPELSTATLATYSVALSGATASAVTVWPMVMSWPGRPVAVLTGVTVPEGALPT